VAFFLAFAIKIPVFPLHTWQPDTYTGAPAAGSMLLAGIMLKMGIYGMIRWMIPICHDAVQEYANVAIILAVTGIVYASVIAIRQSDLKRLVAYSSIAHVGLIAAGVFALTPHALEGAVLQMVSHGINIVGLFIVIDLIEKRTGTRTISELGGIALKAPRLAAIFMVILLASIALPLTNGFVGELLLLLGLFEYSKIFAAIAGLTIIFSAVYMLWMYQRTMLGNTNEFTAQISDLSWGEMAVFVPLVIMIFWIGLFPGLFLDVALPDVLQILNYTK
jgi:NADH-quinone oxidoreductase subunit M